MKASRYKTLSASRQVYLCEDCGCLVVDRTIHDERAHGGPAADMPSLTSVNMRDLDPAVKVRMIEAMGFTRCGSDHQPDCPYALDAGNRCNCVPPAPEWGAPEDVLVYLGETYDERRARPRKPIPDVER